MHPALAHPLKPVEILRNRRAIRRELLQLVPLRSVRIAILGGSTTHEIKTSVELFLLEEGIAPSFYESDYNRFHEDLMFAEPKLIAFNPEIVYFHVTWRNLSSFPPPFASDNEVEAYFEKEVGKFKALWGKANELFPAILIQNNFDFPLERPFGNRDSTERFGRSGLINRLNSAFAEVARQNKKLFIQDIGYLSARIGLGDWFSAEYWYRYKLAISPLATVRLAKNLAGMIKGLLLGNRKCLVLDLDNTLWGGVIGDDGLKGIVLGNDHPGGEAYLGFQKYIKSLQQRGIILAVCSKNELAAAREGFSHPDCVLKLTDFSAFYANWDPKPDNIRLIARDLNIGLDSLVFIDDNPVERAAVLAQLPMVATPDVGSDVTGYAAVIDSEGYFEPGFLAADDSQRTHYYQLNAERQTEQAAFENYDEFLASLEMVGVIEPFRPLYFERITQLTNKTNQYNLTTRRYTLAEIEAAAKAEDKITLSGRLSDRFGDNGLISVLIGTKRDRQLTIDLWLMSCRVLKRGMEHGMFEALLRQCRADGIQTIVGTYIPTEKNALVAEHYRNCGFKPEAAGATAAPGSRWMFSISENSASPKHHIKLETS